MGDLACLRSQSRMIMRRIATRMPAVSRRGLGAVASTPGASSDMVVFRPRVKVTRHTSPFQLDVVTSPEKALKKFGSSFLEYLPDWLPAAALFFITMHLGDSCHQQWSREHAIHGGDGEE